MTHATESWVHVETSLCRASAAARRPSVLGVVLLFMMQPGKYEPVFALGSTLDWITWLISSQWDGFKHFGYQSLGLFYNGTSATHLSGDEMTERLGLHGIGSRIGSSADCTRILGALRGSSDVVFYSTKNGIEYDRLGNHAITVEAPQAVAAAQDVQFRVGDILLVRTGFHHPMKHVGVESSRAMAKWLWDTGFSACASDAPAFEAIPKRSIDIEDLFLHEIMLAGWGMPIGELWELEKLSEHCAQTKRYSFFMTSMPLHVVGGVGSPSNAIAIF
ncbi:cyclase [Pyrenophora seminiperda CCB06]|uniref:Cyclase n=1 Tax=Pyrenophora seminiperda CCB06 TaxID=1302712 RepID=A0A3M7M1I7_9PLEO|nr:cyclase [Pyrenophora seminiperda CCB06]